MNKQAKEKRLPDSVQTSRKPFNGEPSAQTQSPIIILPHPVKSSKRKHNNSKSSLLPLVTSNWRSTNISPLFRSLMARLLVSQKGDRYDKQ